MRLLTVLALLCCLSACNTIGTCDDTVEDLADRIAADLEALPAEDVSVEYSTGLDYRQYLRISATVADKAASDEAMEIIKRDFWTGTGRRIDFTIRLYSASSPPPDGKPIGGTEFSPAEIKFELGDVVEMERKYGPRSTAGELEPGR